MNQTIPSNSETSMKIRSYKNPEFPWHKWGHFFDNFCQFSIQHIRKFSKKNSSKFMRAVKVLCQTDSESPSLSILSSTASPGCLTELSSAGGGESSANSLRTPSSSKSSEKTSSVREQPACFKVQTLHPSFCWLMSQHNVGPLVVLVPSSTALCFAGAFLGVFSGVLVQLRFDYIRCFG